MVGAKPETLLHHVDNDGGPSAELLGSACYNIFMQYHNNSIGVNNI